MFCISSGEIVRLSESVPTVWKKEREKKRIDDDVSTSVSNDAFKIFIGN